MFLKLKKFPFLLGIILFVILLVYLVLSQFFQPTVVIYGDSRSGHTIHQEIVNSIIQTNPVAVFHTGDLVNNGLNPEDWFIFNSITSKLKSISKFYPALGNHENNSELFFDNFILPGNERWYKVVVNGIKFIVLDSESKLEKTSKQYAWLEKILLEGRVNCEFIVMLLHRPLLSSGHYGGKRAEHRRDILSLIKKYEIDIVFAGHNHNYERLFKNGTYHIVTGGGGAALKSQIKKNSFSQVFIKKYHFCEIKVRNKKLLVKVLDKNLNIIDEFKVNHRNVSPLTSQSRKE